MYRVYLIDYDGRWIEMDVEDLEFGLDLAIADLQNLAIRTGSRSKEITFKGTDKNNNAFGWIYRIGRDSNLDLPNKLFFNYNSFRPVDCLIYKDTALVFRGTLRLLEILRQRGVTYYSCVITDAVIDFMKFIQERTLQDLDMSDLKHNYEIGNIIDSWDTRTQRWDGNAYVYEPFELGSGYVYPYIDYGSTQSFDNQVDFYNFRPAVYVNEVFDRIFAQDQLQTFTWELKADPDTTREFNSLIVPNNQEVMKSLPIQYGLTYSRTSGDVWFVKANFTYAWVSGQGLWSVGTKYWLNMNDEIYDPSNTTFFPFEGYDLPLNRAIRRTVTTIETDGIINVKYDIDLAYNGATGRQAVNIALIERKKSNPNWGVNYTGGYDEIATRRIGVFNSSLGVISGDEDLLIPKREFKFDTEWAVVIEIIGSARGGLVSATASFHIPATSNSIVVTNKFNTDIVPVLPEQVKQYDFIKSIMLAFNLYAYVEKERPKHIIFQTYDQFYALFNPAIIKTVALDWTSKLIYNEDFKKIMNLTIPKSYVYTYKEDRDFINVDYKESFNDVYSTLRFKDIYGVQDEKKVELIFGPSPMVMADDRYHTQIRYNDDEQIKPVASQIRLLYYNGVQQCSDYAFVYDGNVGPVIINFYGEGSEYYRNGATFSRSLQWALPKKVYFPVDAYVTTLPNLYSTFHINQVTELTDENLFTLDCKFILNDVDISNFDFRRPIFIQVGNSDIGNSYFKVIKISWKDDKTPASVLLQAVVYSKATNDVPTTTTSTTTTTTTSPEPPPRPDFICVTINGISRTYDYLAGQLGFIEAWYNADIDTAVGRLSSGTWEIREDASDTYILAFESPDTELRPQLVSPWFCVRTPACPDEVSIVSGPCPTTTTTSTTTTTTTQASTTTTTTTSTTSTTTTEASTTTTTTTSTTSTTTTESLATEYFAYQFADVPLTSDLTYDDTNSYYYISSNGTPGNIVFYTEGEINPGPFEKTNDSLASRLAIHESSGDIYFGRSITTGIVRCIGGNFANQEIISVSLSPTPVNTTFYGFDIDQTNNVLYYTLLDDKIYKINLGIGNSASSIAATVSGTLFKLAVNQTNSDVYALAAYRDIYKVDIAGNTYSLIAGITGSIDIAHKENNNILYTVVSDISASPVVTPGIYAMTSTGSNITKIEFCGTWSSVNNYPKWLHIESDNNNDNLFVSSRSNNVGTYSQYNLKLVPCNQTTTTSTTTTTTTEATTTTSTTTETTTEASTTTSTTTETTTEGTTSTTTETTTITASKICYKLTQGDDQQILILVTAEKISDILWQNTSNSLIGNLEPGDFQIKYNTFEDDWTIEVNGLVYHEAQDTTEMNPLLVDWISGPDKPEEAQLTLTDGECVPESICFTLLLDDEVQDTKTLIKISNVFWEGENIAISLGDVYFYLTIDGAFAFAATTEADNPVDAAPWQGYNSYVGYEMQLVTGPCSETTTTTSTTTETTTEASTTTTTSTSTSTTTVETTYCGIWRLTGGDDPDTDYDYWWYTTCDAIDYQMVRVDRGEFIDVCLKENSTGTSPIAFSDFGVGTKTRISSCSVAALPETICLTLNKVGVGEIKSTMTLQSPTYANTLGYFYCWYDDSNDFVLGRDLNGDGRWLMESDETGIDNGVIRFISLANTNQPQNVAWDCYVEGCPWGTLISIEVGACSVSTTTTTTTEGTTSTTTETTTEGTTSTTTETTTEGTTSTTTETTTEGTTSTTTETTTENTTSTTTETTTEGTTSTTTETTTEGTTSTTTETTTEGTTSTTTETTTEGTTSTTTTTTTVTCYEWTATNNTANQEAVFWYDCCTGMELSEFLDPQTQTVVCARQTPTGNVTITGGTFVCEPECTTTTSTTTETTTEGTTSTTTTTTTEGTTSTTTTTTTGSESTTTTTTSCCYSPLYYGSTLAEACINQTNAEFLVNGYFSCDSLPLTVGEFIYTDCSLETGLANGFYWYDTNTVYQITDQETAGQIWTISSCPSACIEYSVFNNKYDNSITISWYDCSGSQQTQVIAERTSFNFCANTGLGPINVPADGTLSSVGPCNTTTENPS